MATFVAHVGVDPKSPQEEERDLRFRGDARLDLPPGLWTIIAKVDGFWTEPRDVLVEENAPPTEVVFKLWPRSTLTGSFSSAGGAPNSLETAFDPGRSASQKGFAPAPSAGVKCPVAHGQFRCALPAGTFNLQLRAEGFVPHYLWDANLPAGQELSLGGVSFVRGASVVGIVRSSLDAPVGGARVMLADPSGAPIGGLATAVTNRVGFFQIATVPPGEYLVVAELASFAPDKTPVRVLQGQESDVRLTVLQPRSLDVFVDPPTAPGGGPWLIRLRTFVPDGRQLRVIQPDVTVPSDGHWRGNNLALSPGSYVPTISTRSGEVWFDDVVEIASEPEPIRVTVASLKVRGTVRCGGRPIPASVVFGGSHGGIRVPLRADENGEFSGIVPLRPPEAWSVTVEATTPPIIRNLEKVSLIPDPASGEAYLEIALPDTLLEGVVVDLAGRPLDSEDAMVTAQHEGNEESVQTVASHDADGRFRLEGLPSGRYHLLAEAAGLVSDEVAVKVLPSESPAPVRLILKQQLQVIGRILSADGGAVPGALVKVYPAQAPLMPVPVARTDAEGRVTAFLPAGTREIGLGVGAVGFAYRTLRLPLSSKNAFQVIMEPTGGTLHIRMPPQPDKRAMAVLLSHGFHEEVDYLKRWAALHGAPFEQEGEIVLPQMAAGQYAACLTLPEEFPALLSGAGALMEACTKGILPVGGDLTLELRR